MSKIYYQERNHPNWTGRVPRQSRITGQWAVNRQVRLPLGDVIAVVLGALAILAVMFV